MVQRGDAARQQRAVWKRSLVDDGSFHTNAIELLIRQVFSAPVFTARPEPVEGQICRHFAEFNGVAFHTGVWERSQSARPGSLSPGGRGWGEGAADNAPAANTAPCQHPKSSASSPACGAGAPWMRVSARGRGDDPCRPGHTANAPSGRTCLPCAPAPRPPRAASTPPASAAASWPAPCHRAKANPPRKHHNTKTARQTAPDAG